MGTRWKPWLPIGIALASFFVFLAVSAGRRIGTYGLETDFYGDYAPDAARLRAGEIPQNGYQGPGYPAILALTTGVVKDPFWAGRLISVASAATVGLLAFALFRRLFGYWTGVGSQLLVLVSGIFPRLAVTASTDILFLMLCLAALVAFCRTELPAPWRVGIAGLLTGMAYLTRYNGVFLIPVFLGGIGGLKSFGPGAWRRIRLSCLFLGLSFLVALPWFYANLRHNGSALFNLNHLNIATEFYGDRFGADKTGDGTAIMSERFDSLSEVVRYDPLSILRQYPANLWKSLRHSLSTRLVGPLVGIAAIVGVVVALWKRRSGFLAIIALAWALYFLLMALNHFEPRYYLFPAVIYAGLAAYAAVRLGDWAARRGRGFLRTRATGVLAFALLWALSLRASAADVRTFLRTEPIEVLDACAYLRGQGIRDARILARKPHLAFVCQQRNVAFPRVQSVEELRRSLAGTPVDYVVISSVEISKRRGLASLQDPAAAPPWLAAVWVHEDPLFILFKPAVVPLAGRARYDDVMELGPYSGLAVETRQEMVTRAREASSPSP
ncbi:MAG: glycosyltransferase family 39 protein [Thermoanaerobaculia bacterium]